MKVRAKQVKPREIRIKVVMELDAVEAEALYDALNYEPEHTGGISWGELRGRLVREAGFPVKNFRKRPVLKRVRLSSSDLDGIW